MIPSLSLSLLITLPRGILLHVHVMTSHFQLKKGRAKKHLLKEDPNSVFWFSYFLVILVSNQSLFFFSLLPERKVVRVFLPPATTPLPLLTSE